MKSIIDQAVHMLRAVLPVISDEDRGFRVEFSSDIDGAVKRIVVVGSASRRVENGSAIVIINPDEEIASSIHGDTHYASIADYVRGHCDAAYVIWHEAYVNEGKGVTSTVDKYQARELSEPRSVTPWRKH